MDEDLLNSTKHLLPLAIIAGFVLFGQIGLQPPVCFLLSMPGLSMILATSELNHTTIMAAVLCGWGLNSITSPFAVPLLLVSRSAGISSFDLAWQKNFFVLAISPILCGLVLGAQM